MTPTTPDWLPAVALLVLAAFGVLGIGFLTGEVAVAVAAIVVLVLAAVFGWEWWRRGQRKPVPAPSPPRPAPPPSPSAGITFALRDGRVVLSFSHGGATLVADVAPSVARLWAAQLTQLADALGPPRPEAADPGVGERLTEALCVELDAAAADLSRTAPPSEAPPAQQGGSR